MKLEMTLPERPGFLHAVPILNIFALMQLFFLLGPSLVLQSGVAVDLPPSKFQMERYQESLVVTLSPHEPAPFIHFGRESVTQAELAERLDKLRAGGSTTKAIVLLQTDAGTPVGIEREITELVLAKGFRLAIVGKTPPATAPAKPPVEK
ncbi:MAG: biopolymer transporter ExbD [Luteolibacter sp.]|uniref:biopolymer transporter ExbD n=1 Tax=Luteolibacter sp. TaxID=1962973 RepID=UPI003267E675